MLLGRTHGQTSRPEGRRPKITLSGPPPATRPLEGTLAHEGQNAGKILGLYHFRAEPYPAQLEKTTDAKVAGLKQGPLVAKYIAAASKHDPKSKVRRSSRS